ncbi:hypothetical protein DRE_06276 [Drechslerella stenobrocha 248]|uniref:MARVEL domain-containing protein n=1 Tax=Drechslerella stenobrocha 248 TaxID=1043628 RepID=W7HLZ2_9PEZI|nr:hypothetical protein DRE_06276 [Drechslerella stenobrocha 248]
MSYDVLSPDNYDGSDPGWKDDIKDVEKVAQLTQKLVRRQKQVQGVRVFERVINLLSSTVITAIMAYTLEQYLVTKNEVVNGVGPFGANPKLWPTYVMLSVGVVTLLFNLSVLLAYCCGSKAADKVAAKSIYIKLLSPIGHLIVWGTTAASFNLASTGNDIWGFSCSEDPSVVAIQEDFKKVAYEQLCTVNTVSSYASIATAAFAVVGVIIWVVAAVYTRKRVNLQKKLESVKRFESYRGSSAMYTYRPSGYV